MTKKKTKKTNTIVEEIQKPIGVVIGHKVEDMQYMIQKYQDNGLDVLVATWPRYQHEINLGAGKVFVKKTPEKQGMDCVNLVIEALDMIFYAIPNDSIIAQIGNCHTHPISYDYNLTCEEWKKVFELDKNSKEYVNDVVVRNYNNLFR